MPEGSKHNLESSAAVEESGGHGLQNLPIFEDCDSKFRIGFNDIDEAGFNPFRGKGFPIQMKPDQVSKER
jgi:hypothetical protein